MANTTTKTTFAEFFKGAIVDVIKEDNALGDRSKYIGASDIAGCPRKVYLDKINPNKEISPEEAMIFTRGHLAELIIKEGLNKKGIKYKFQEEIENGYIKAHLDFLFEKKDEVIVVECKTSSSIPKEPYESWVLQVQLQMHLANHKYNKFTRAYVIVMNINTGEIQDFEIQYSEAMAEIALKRAENLWNALQNNEDPKAEEQLYCSKCSHRGECPVFKRNAEQLSDVLTKELQVQIKKIKELEAQEKALKQKKETLKKEVEEFMRAKELNKIDLGDSVISLSRDTESMSLDTSALKKDDPELFEELLSKYNKTTKRKGYIRIK